MRNHIPARIPIALGIALTGILWIGSGLIADERTEAPADALAQKSAPDDRRSRQTLAPEQADLPTVRVRRSVAAPHRAVMVLRGQTEVERSVTLRAETEGRVSALPTAEGAVVTEESVLVALAEDDRRARRNEALASLERARIAANAAERLRSKGFQSQLALAEARANLASARANLKTIDIDIARATVTAPFAGILETRLVEIGDAVQQGDELGTIVDLDPIIVSGQVSEKEIAAVRVGETARAVLADGHKLTGRVRYVATVADPMTRTFRIEIEAPNAAEDPSRRIPANVTGEIRIDLDPVLAHRVSPAILTLADDGTLGIKLLDDRDQVMFTPVRVIDDRTEGLWVAGLPDVARIVTVGQEFVIDGQQVAPMAERPNAQTPDGRTPVAPVERAVPISRQPGDDAERAGDAS